MMEKVIIYCDGSCLKNPGPGGWAALLIFTTQGKLHEKMISGGSKMTTNNQMELRAATKGLLALKRKCVVNIHSDSKYVVTGMKEWIKKWHTNGFKNASKKEIANKEFWLKLDEADKRHDVSWNWVKAHSGHKENDRVDEEARRQATLFLKR